MQLEEEAASIAEHRANLVPPPERGGRRGAVLTNGLWTDALDVSDCSHGLCDDKLSANWGLVMEGTPTNKTEL